MRHQSIMRILQLVAAMFQYQRCKSGSCRPAHVLLLAVRWPAGLLILIRSPWGCCLPGSSVLCLFRGGYDSRCLLLPVPRRSRVRILRGSSVSFFRVGAAVPSNWGTGWHFRTLQVDLLIQLFGSRDHEHTQKKRACTIVRVQASSCLHCHVGSGVCAWRVVNSSRGRRCVQRASVKKHKLCEGARYRCVPFF